VVTVDINRATRYKPRLSKVNALNAKAKALGGKAKARNFGLN